jgi:hypothetical protein
MVREHKEFLGFLSKVKTNKSSMLNQSSQEVAAGV